MTTAVCVRTPSSRWALPWRREPAALLLRGWPVQSAASLRVRGRAQRDRQQQRGHLRDEPAHKLQVTRSAGATSWNVISSRVFKEDIRKLDPVRYRELLRQSQSLDFASYRYKTRYGVTDDDGLGWWHTSCPVTCRPRTGTASTCTSSPGRRRGVESAAAGDRRHADDAGRAARDERRPRPTASTGARR